MMGYKDTELTLGLPGGGSRGCSNGVVVFGELMMKTIDDLEPESYAGEEPCGQVRPEDGQYSSSSSTSSATTAVKAPTEKGQVVGWPPVRSMRMKVLDSKQVSRKYVKVGADGAPYLRKVNLEMYQSYKELFKALEAMFTTFTISVEDKQKQEVIMENAVVNGIVGLNHYVVTYEDKDGDWMLVGDVPWKMFKESCKRIRLMKSSSEAVLR